MRPRRSRTRNGPSNPPLRGPWAEPHWRREEVRPRFAQELSQGRDRQEASDAPATGGAGRCGNPLPMREMAWMPRQCGRPARTDEGKMTPGVAEESETARRRLRATRNRYCE